MGQEIERKFLIAAGSQAFKTEAAKQTRITQGYLSSVPERTVRIRVKGDKGFITIKGIGNASGASRFEWETEIPLSDAQELLKICEPGIIDKIRYEIKAGNHTIEVDEFHGENKGLIVAEVELEGEDDQFEQPEWMGVEVTGDVRYYNAQLMKKPYSKW